MNIDPDMASCKARSPLEQYAGIILLEPATTCKGMPIQRLQHLADAALPDDSLSILPNCQALQLVYRLLTGRWALVYLIVVVFPIVWHTENPVPMSLERRAHLLLVYTH